MSCPTLNELPPPPEGKTGWPWTEETESLTEKMPEGFECPKISIVTPNYNYGQFIEETIRSVLLQGYPNLEYIVIDSASTDNSVEIIKKYQKWLTYWESESDSGQSNAINKGVLKATGQWVNWLNSDDFLLPNAMNQLAIKLASYDESAKAVITSCQILSEDGESIKELWHPRKPKSIFSFFDSKNYPVIPQPSTFIRREQMKVLEGYHYVMDWTLYIMLEDSFPGSFRELDTTTAALRTHNASKTSTSSEKFTDESISFLNESKFKTKNINKHIQKKIARVKNSQAIGKILLDNNNSSLLDLCLLLIHSPYLLTNRMFLGAIKKIIVDN